MFACIITLVERSLKTVLPIILGDIIDIVDADSDESWDSMKTPILNIVAASLGNEACTFIRKFIIECIGTELQKKSFLDQARKLLHVRVDALQEKRSRELTIRMDRNVEELLKILKEIFLDRFSGLFAAVIAMA